MQKQCRSSADRLNWCAICTDASAEASAEEKRTALSFYLAREYSASYKEGVGSRQEGEMLAVEEILGDWQATLKFNDGMHNRCLVAWGKTRGKALRAMAAACREDAVASRAFSEGLSFIVRTGLDSCGDG